MIKGSKVLDDVAQLAGGAVGLISHVQQQIQNDIRERIDDMIAKLDLVPREDLERVEAVAVEARKKQAELEKRIADLETKMAGTKTAKTSTATTKTTKPKTSSRTTSRKTTKKSA